MGGIGLVVNPRAGRNVRDPDQPARLERQLGDAGVMRLARSRGELRRVAEEFKRLDIDVLVIAGGDGTNHVTLTGFIDVYGEAPLPAVSFLRGGTMNTVANSFGIPRLRPQALLELTKQSHAERSQRPLRFSERHLLRVGPQYGFLFGTGAIYGYIAEYSRKPARSPLWAAVVLGRAVAAWPTSGPALQRVVQRWEGRVRFDDGSAFPDRDYLAIGASTTVQIGLGFKPFYRSADRTDHFHILGIFASAGQFIRGLPQVWRGRPLGATRSYEKLTRNAVLEGRRSAVPYMLDGDIYRHEGPLDVALGPRLRVLVPR